MSRTLLTADRLATREARWQGDVDATLAVMSRFVEDIRHAVARGDLPQCFRPDDVRQAWSGLG
jgi:hypothetical protein